MGASEFMAKPQAFQITPLARIVSSNLPEIGSITVYLGELRNQQVRRPHFVAFCFLQTNNALCKTVANRF